MTARVHRECERVSISVFRLFLGRRRCCCCGCCLMASRISRECEEFQKNQNATLSVRRAYHGHGRWVVSSNCIVPNIHLCIIFGSSVLFSSFVSINGIGEFIFFSCPSDTYSAHCRGEEIERERAKKNEQSFSIMETLVHSDPPRVCGARACTHRM